MWEYFRYLAIGAGAITAVILLFTVFRKPVKALVRAVGGNLLGLGAMLLINLTSLSTGVTVAVNTVTLLVIGALGLPGLMLVLALKLIYI